MSARASIAALLLLSCALLTGCSICYRTASRTTEATEDTIGTADGQQDTQTTSAQLQEDVRLANERAKLAEEKSELERQKREFAEERLKQLNKTDGNDKGESHTEGKAAGES